MFPDLSKNRSDAIGWFKNQWRNDDTGTGWRHSSRQPRVTGWGGTMDAVRALMDLGESPHNPKISQAIDWLESEQYPDGGWGFWEVSKSAVESTAWGVITLKKANRDLNDECLRKGVEYLVDTAQKQATGYAWGSSYNHECRIYPTLVASWALNGLEQEYANGGIDWLKTVDNQDGGWGFLPNDTQSTIVTTAMVLYILRRIGKLGLTDQQTMEAREYILDCQSDSGGWNNKVERWNIDEEGQIKLEHGTDPWALLALLETDIGLEDDHVLNAVHHIAGQQNRSGAYLYDMEDPEENTWYTANCTIALDRFSESLSSPVGVRSIVSKSVSEEFGPLSNQLDDVSRRLESLEEGFEERTERNNETYRQLKIHLPIVYMLLFIIGLVVSGYHEWAIRFATNNQVELLITAVGAALSVIFGKAYQRIKTRKEN